MIFLQKDQFFLHACATNFKLPFNKQTMIKIALFVTISQGGTVRSKVIILDGNSEHVTPARRRIGLFGEKKSDM